MLRRVAVVRTDVSEERMASIIRLLQFLVTAYAVPSSPILVTLVMEGIRSSETSVLTRATRHHIADNGIRHSRRRETLKSFIRMGSVAET
jgi:hypothetical protein